MVSELWSIYLNDVAFVPTTANIIDIKYIYSVVYRCWCEDESAERSLRGQLVTTTGGYLDVYSVRWRPPPSAMSYNSSEFYVGV